MATIVDWLAEENPQLVRELKGRLKPRNVALAATLSLLSQLLLYGYFVKRLPTADELLLTTQSTASRYCTGPSLGERKFECILDLQSNVMLLKELWWLDLFVAISLASIAVLIGVGITLLVSDLSREKSRGTLSLIRLSPRSASSILIGKFLGVPILLHLALALAIPLHVGAGLAAGVSLGLIVGFYGVLAASCACFYSLAILVGLIGKGREARAVWLSLAVLSWLFVLTSVLASKWSFAGFALDWLKLFNPSTVLPYLVQSTFLPHRTVGYFDVHRLMPGLWYGQPLWQEPGSAIGFMVLNYAGWTYWLWQASKRQFRQPTAAIWSKEQSYWLSGFFTLITLGFALQNAHSDRLLINFSSLLFQNAVFFLLLIAALSPHRQALQDWARYRHQTSQRSLVAELLWGEKSPAPVAIAFNIAIVVGLTLPSVLLFPVNNAMAVVAGFFLSGSLIILYAVVAQLLLMMKSEQRSTWATATIGTGAIAPVLYLGLMEMPAGHAPEAWLWLLSLQPLAATAAVQTTTMMSVLLVQWLAIVVCAVQMTRQLRHFSQSQTKALFVQGKDS